MEVTYSALGQAIPIAIGIGMLWLSIRKRFDDAHLQSEERARQTYQKIEALRTEIGQTYVRKDVYEADGRARSTREGEVDRRLDDVTAQLRCPVRAAE